MALVLFWLEPPTQIYYVEFKDNDGYDSHPIFK